MWHWLFGFEMLGEEVCQHEIAWQHVSGLLDEHSLEEDAGTVCCLHAWNCCVGELVTINVLADLVDIHSWMRVICGSVSMTRRFVVVVHVLVRVYELNVTTLTRGERAS